MRLNIVNLGTIEYEEALKIQYELVERRQQGLTGNTLLLLEHPPVLTLGVRGELNHIYLPHELLEKEGVSVINSNRGGDVTYHGPGQIVGYPIMRIQDFSGGIRQFVENIKSAIIRLLKDEFGIEAYGQSDKYTGVWVDDKKITAIGLAVQKGISMHGFAFNVNTNLKHFDWINPCGLSKGVTSVEALTGKKADVQRIASLTAEYFAKEFGCEPVRTELTDILA